MNRKSKKVCETSYPIKNCKPLKNKILIMAKNKNARFLKIKFIFLK